MFDDPYAGHPHGPGFLRGLLFLAVCVIAAVRLDSDPWAVIALWNAILHFAIGILVWPWTPTARYRVVKLLFVNIWFLTVATGFILFAMSFFVV